MLGKAIEFCLNMKKLKHKFILETYKVGLLKSLFFRCFILCSLPNFTNCRTIISTYFSRLSTKLVTFFHSKIKFHRSYALALFIRFSVAVAMLPIIAEKNVI